MHQRNCRNLTTVLFWVTKKFTLKSETVWVHISMAVLLQRFTVQEILLLNRMFISMSPTAFSILPAEEKPLIQRAIFIFMPPPVLPSIPLFSAVKTESTPEMPISISATVRSITSNAAISLARQLLLWTTNSFPEPLKILMNWNFWTTAVGRSLKILCLMMVCVLSFPLTTAMFPLMRSFIPAIQFLWKALWISQLKRLPLTVSGSCVPISTFQMFKSRSTAIFSQTTPSFTTVFFIP